MTPSVPSFKIHSRRLPIHSQSHWQEQTVSEAKFIAFQVETQAQLSRTAVTTGELKARFREVSAKSERLEGEVGSLSMQLRIVQELLGNLLDARELTALALGEAENGVSLLVWLWWRFVRSGVEK